MRFEGVLILVPLCVLDVLLVVDGSYIVRGTGLRGLDRTGWREGGLNGFDSDGWVVFVFVDELDELEELDRSPIRGGTRVWLVGVGPVGSFVLDTRGN